ncbi:MAG: hypothetical protein CM15mP81_16240 [Alphaproteobacteria bacterium]|nr:MAG: hypothetical protein CM15mP81_16240 [Alphaproteobacteria bacterium]
MVILYSIDSPELKISKIELRLEFLELNIDHILEDIHFPLTYTK